MRGRYRFVCYYDDVPRLYDAFEYVACVDGDAGGGDVYGDDGEHASYTDGGIYEDDVWTGYDNDDEESGDDDCGAWFCHRGDGNGVDDDDDDNDDVDDGDEGGGGGDGDDDGKSFVPSFSWGQPPLI